MKPGILLIVAAMAFAVAGISDAPARAWYGHHGLQLRLAGSSFTTNTEDDGTFESLQNGIAQGRYGRALVAAQTTAGPAMPDARCPAHLPVGGTLSTTVVLTYNDGSIISGSSADGNYYCSDGVVFAATFVGTLLGGDGRFEGATGTFEIDAEVVSSRLTGTMRVDVD